MPRAAPAPANRDGGVRTPARRARRVRRLGVVSVLVLCAAFGIGPHLFADFGSGPRRWIATAQGAGSPEGAGSPATDSETKPTERRSEKPGGSRDDYRKNRDRWQKLPPEKRQELLKIYERLRGLPPAERQRLLERLRQLDEPLRRELLQRAKESEAARSPGVGGPTTGPLPEPIAGPARGPRAGDRERPGTRDDPQGRGPGVGGGRETFRRGLQGDFERAWMGILRAHFRGAGDDERRRYEALPPNERRAYVKRVLQEENERLLAQLTTQEREPIEALPPAERARRLRQALAEKTLTAVFGDAASVAKIRERAESDLRALWVRSPRSPPERPAFVTEEAWGRWLQLSGLERSRVLQHLSGSAARSRAPGRPWRGPGGRGTGGWSPQGRGPGGRGAGEGDRPQEKSAPAPGSSPPPHAP